MAGQPTPTIHVEETSKQTASVHAVELYGQSEEWVTRREVEASRSTVKMAKREAIAFPDGTRHESEMTLEATAEQMRQVVAERGARQEQAAVELSAESSSEMARPVTVSAPEHDLRIAGLVGYDDGVLYGAAVDRRILGPVTLGAWGLSSGTVGVGVGVSW